MPYKEAVLTHIFFGVVLVVFPFLGPRIAILAAALAVEGCDPTNLSLIPHRDSIGSPAATRSLNP